MMTNENILQEVRQTLKACAEEQYRQNSQKYFKEKISSHGVRTPTVRRIAKKYFKCIKHLGKKQVFALAEELLKKKYNEETTIAVQWVGEFAREFKKNDFRIFENWLKKYIDNWGKDDDFCLHIIHPIIEKYPTLISKVKLWAYSGNMWLRRASAVSFITTIGPNYATKHGLNDIFEVAETLMRDKEDLVQKGYGWMLKAASINNSKRVFRFVIHHKTKMTRTALRYAIEKMPADLKKQAMKKQ